MPGIARECPHCQDHGLSVFDFLGGFTFSPIRCKCCGTEFRFRPVPFAVLVLIEMSILIGSFLYSLRIGSVWPFIVALLVFAAARVFLGPRLLRRVASAGSAS